MPPHLPEIPGKPIPNEKTSETRLFQLQEQIKSEGIRFLEGCMQTTKPYHESRTGFMIYPVRARDTDYGNLPTRTWLNRLKKCIYKCADTLGTTTVEFTCVQGQWMWRKPGKAWQSLPHDGELFILTGYNPEKNKWKDFNALNHIAKTLQTLTTQAQKQFEHEHPGNNIVRMDASLEIPNTIATNSQNLVSKTLEIPTENGTKKLALETFTTPGDTRKYLLIRDMDTQDKYLLHSQIGNDVLDAMDSIRGKRIGNGTNFNALEFSVRVDVKEKLKKSSEIPGWLSTIIKNLSGPQDVVIILDTASIQRIATAIARKEKNVALTLRLDTQKTSRAAQLLMNWQAKNEGYPLGTDPENRSYRIAVNAPFELRQVE